MKKIILTLALIVLPMTSWQSWSVLMNRLVVHETSAPTSAICYQGGAENYDGTCVSPAAPTGQYLQKLEDERNNK